MLPVDRERRLGNTVCSGFMVVKETQIEAYAGDACDAVPSEYERGSQGTDPIKNGTIGYI